jgi:sugar (pentulose or hexulose) kinase
MKEYILALDLGTTEIKYALYDHKLSELAIISSIYNLEINGKQVEFEAEEYWTICKKGIKDIVVKAGIDAKNIRAISLSSQAETLVLVDKEGQPLRKAISWLDNRSSRQCDHIKKKFDENKSFQITGQPGVVNTWPVTKILWIRENQPQIFENASKFLLLKDYIIYKLTGRYISEYTVYNFSYYFDIISKEYWQEMLDFTGISTDRLPELVEPGKDIGNLEDRVIKELGFSSKITLNVGALDQMSGMLGTGNIKEGIVSEATGTVLAISTMKKDPLFSELKVPCHYNAIKDSYILLMVCESGGINLGWFKDNLYMKNDFEEINRDAASVPRGSEDLIYLPYIAGVNSPEYDPDARGVFYGINITHSSRHFARAVMEGVAFLIRKNLEHFGKLGVNPEKVISLGGGSKSDVWNQIKADVTGKKIVVNSSRESASLGAAIMAAAGLGYFSDIPKAVDEAVKIRKIFKPLDTGAYDRQYRLFLDVYDRLFKNGT